MAGLKRKPKDGQRRAPWVFRFTEKRPRRGGGGKKEIPRADELPELLKSLSLFHRTCRGTLYGPGMALWRDFNLDLIPDL